MITSLENSGTNKEQNWFAGVDSLRFILAFTVVMGHFFNPSIDALKSSPYLLLKIFSYFYSVAFVGPAAVIAFFIISGFVIHYPYKNRPLNLRKFYIRRFVRVAIPLIVVTIAGHPLGDPEKGVCWSLYCELIYYALYPFIVRIKISWNIKIITASILSLLVMLLMTKNEFRSFIAHKDNNFNGSYTQLGIFYTWIIGLPCWLTGVKLAENINVTYKTVKFSNLLLLRLISWLAAVFCLVTRFHMYLSYIHTLNFLCFIFYFWLQAEINYYRQAKPIAFLESFGKFSYSLYLCHPVFLVLIGKFFIVGLYNYFLFIILIVFLSYLFYLLVEKQAHYLAKKLANV